jgi:shikimate kinase
MSAVFFCFCFFAITKSKCIMTNASDNPPFKGLGGKVFLIGFMGSGKTYWGKIWAQQKGLAFYDLDEVIEKEQGKTISVIFEKHGEDHFRKIEASALRYFAETENCIIACGGGTACFNENMQWMNENGTTVYLSATPPYILSRVKEEKDKRPLINKLNEAELLFFIEQKLKEREPFYNQAKIILPVTELNDDSLST